MKIEQSTSNGACLDKTVLPGLWEVSDLMRTPKNEGLKSSASLGHVLIVSEDHSIRDFLGQILNMHGYDCDFLEVLPKGMMDKPLKGIDALFIESHFLEQLKQVLGHGGSSATGYPLVVVLGDLPPPNETGLFRVLKKPLDYRQMGTVMDALLLLKTHRHASQGEQESERSR